uniref:Uncharacterized protein n=1 Tax=Cacopsylla melanoneura TaxID=428564 RepID=A0A8D9BLX2_9HEMI
MNKKQPQTTQNPENITIIGLIMKDNNGTNKKTNNSNISYNSRCSNKISTSTGNTNNSGYINNSSTNSSGSSSGSTNNNNGSSSPNNNNTTNNEQQQQQQQ